MLRILIYGLIVGVIVYFAVQGGGGENVGEIVMTIGLVVLFFELCYFASRVFKEEVKWCTLPVVMMLPTSTTRLAYHKVLGCLIGVIPGILFFTLGAFLNPYHLSDIALGIGLGLPGVIFFLHLVVFFSLAVKRGGLALSFLVGYFGYSILGALAMFLFFTNPTAGIILMFVIFIGLSLAFHFAIGAQLRKAASQ
jgi:hypothetical protein